MKFPDTLNDYEVVAWIPREPDFSSWFVVVRRPDDFVVATWHPGITHGWVHGNYGFETIGEAMDYVWMRERRLSAAAA